MKQIERALASLATKGVEIERDMHGDVTGFKVARGSLGIKSWGRMDFVCWYFNARYRIL